MDIGLLILRVVLGLLVIGHGTQKAFGWFQAPGPSAMAALFDEWGFRPGRLMVYVAAVTECVGGLLIILGLATPLASAMLIGTMTVACVPNMVNGLWALRGGYELALIYAVMAVVVGFTGSGRYSIDYLLGVPQSPWTGPAAVVVGLGATVPILLRRHIILSRQAPRTTSASPEVSSGQPRG